MVVLVVVLLAMVEGHGGSLLCVVEDISNFVNLLKGITVFNTYPSKIEYSKFKRVFFFSVKGVI